MQRTFNFFEKHFSSFLLFFSISLAISNIFSKGNPRIYFSNTWLAVFLVLGVYLSIITAIKLYKKNYVKGLILFLTTLLLTFYFLNVFNFSHEYLSIEDFDPASSTLLRNETVILLDHGFGDTEKLKNYERATFLYNSEEIIVELNKPLKLKNNKKILLTGNGKDLLVTRSEFLIEMVLIALIIMFLSIILTGKQWKR